MSASDRPLANPSIVLREEFDDWAILFDPDSGRAYGINPVSVFVWKRLDGQRSVDQIIGEVKGSFNNVPAEADEDIRQFVQGLVERGWAGFEVGTG